MSDLKQALRNAIEVERGAERFYRSLASKASDADGRKFLERMVADEKAHAEALEQKSRELVDGKLPEYADYNMDRVERVPEWGNAEGISFEQALQVALEAEQHAELFYDALADTAPTPALQEFFRAMTANEARHVEAVAKQIERHGKK